MMSRTSDLTFPSFAYLPFELRHEIWQYAAKNEARVHNLMTHRVPRGTATESASDRKQSTSTKALGPTKSWRGSTLGFITFDTLRDGNSTETADSRHGNSPYKYCVTLKYEPFDLGLWEVCPESRKVMEANEGCVSGSYTSETDNGTRNKHAIIIHPDNDLLFFHFPEHWETRDWARIKHDLPCFGKRGVGHIALEVDQHWYEFRHSNARAQLLSAANGRSYDKRFVNFLVSIQPMWDRVDWREHGWFSWNWDTIDWTEHVWLVDCEIRRRGGETPYSYDISGRHVFRGDGYRYVEVREEDAGIWDFHWGYREKDKPGYKGKRGKYSKDRTVFDFLREMQNWVGIYAGRSVRPSPTGAPTVGVLALERST